MPRSFALLDTNIFQYGYDDKFKQSALDLITIVGNNYEVATTSYTKFELFRGMSGAKINKAKVVYENVARLEVDDDDFRMAAAVATCYARDDVTKPFASRYSDGDVILAGIAFKNDAVIVTANINDFPRPYFEEVTGWKRNMLSTTGRYVQAAVLAPNPAYLNTRIKEFYYET